jgi:hypothetical protein
LGFDVTFFFRRTGARFAEMLLLPLSWLASSLSEDDASDSEMGDTGSRTTSTNLIRRTITGLSMMRTGVTHTGAMHTGA